MAYGARAERADMNKYKAIPSSFFERSTLAIAKDLLGKYIVHRTKQGIISGKIVETEAYLNDDPASHSFKGKTQRNASMFEKAGTSYVYFTYGMYHCFNIVTGRKGIGEAVLIRALEPGEGIEIMRKNRKMKDTDDIKNLCNGPAKLVIALDIGKEHDGLDLLSKNASLQLVCAPEVEKRAEMVQTARIGISKGKELSHRFYIKDNSFVSRK